MALINKNLVLPTPVSSANLSPVQAAQAAKGVTEMDRQRQAQAEGKEAAAVGQGVDTSFAAALRRRIEPASSKSDPAQGESKPDSSQATDSTTISTDPSLLLAGTAALPQVIWPWAPPVQNQTGLPAGLDSRLGSETLPGAMPALASALAGAMGAPLSAAQGLPNSQPQAGLTGTAANDGLTSNPASQSTTLDTVFSAALGNAAAKATGLDGATADFAAQLTRQMAEAGRQKGEAQTSLLDASQNAQAAQASLAAQPVGHQAAADVPAIPVQTPVSSAHWGQEVGQKLVWMANNQEQKAELVLNPQHLGRIEVSISVSNDLTNTQFVCATPEARQALEQALPQLREMFAQAGLSLGQASVGADTSSNRDERSPSNRRGSEENSIAPIAATRSGSIRLGQGVVDTYA